MDIGISFRITLINCRHQNKLRSDLCRFLLFIAEKYVVVMGNILVKLLQRAVPALKEHQKTIEILNNQNLIKDQEIISLKNQKELIEQQVQDLAVEVEELKINSRRILMLGGLFAVAGLLYIKNHSNLEIRVEDSDQESDGEVGERQAVEIPDSLECIICMENLKEVMLEPCGHVCICRACAERMRLPSGRVKCPVCRVRADTRTVFIT